MPRGTQTSQACKWTCRSIINQHDVHDDTCIINQRQTERQRERVLSRADDHYFQVWKSSRINYQYNSYWCPLVHDGCRGIRMNGVHWKLWKDAKEMEEQRSGLQRWVTVWWLSWGWCFRMRNMHEASDARRSEVEVGGIRAWSRWERRRCEEVDGWL